jgi:hypothetical protein
MDIIRRSGKVMKIERKELEKRLHEVLIDINTNRDIKDRITNLMKERHGYTTGEAKKMLNETISIEVLSPIELCILTIATYDITGDSIGKDINPETFFIPREIIDAGQYQKPQKSRERRLIFNNVEQLADRQWICPKRSYKEIAEDLKYHRVTYNKDTQRDAIIEEYGEKSYLRQNIMPSKVSAIKKEILQGTFTSNLLTYNILRTGKEHFLYDEDSKQLIVETDEEYTQCDIVDGANRTYSIAEIINEQPDFIGNMVISILNYKITEAQHYIRQEQQSTPISKELQERYDKNDLNMSVAKDISTYENQLKNELFGKVAINNDDLRIRNKYVTLHVLKEAISQNFEFTTPTDSDMVVIHVVKVINFIVKYFRDRYGNIDEARKEYNILQNNMFYGYLVMAGKVYNRDDWQDEVRRILDNTDFSKGNPLWKKMSIESAILPKRGFDSLVKYFSAVNE